MAFGYFPDYKGKSKLKDWYLRIFGYPYAPRRNEVRLVFKLLDPKLGEGILDIGCGDGIWTNEVAKRGVKVVGLDYSGHAVAKAKERARLSGLQVEYVCGDAQAMPFADASFDKAFSISTFEHIENDISALRECHRVLKGGGSLVISTPTPKYPRFFDLVVKLPKAIKRGLFKEYIVEATSGREFRRLLDKKYQHYRTYTLDDLNDRFTGVGFALSEVLFNIGFLGIIPHTLIHSLKIFDWEKSGGVDYSFKSMILIAATFPLFYPLYRLDALGLRRFGYSLVVKAKKIV